MIITRKSALYKIREGQKWHKYFAWFPVKLQNSNDEVTQYALFEYVERRLDSALFDYHWIYRKLEKS